ncbi:hypothetical protein G6011_04355 [Alternaria panax]|uniref:RNB domain-containing protein n=1 Tax=Alternaria panax TaxID=48097 RepID=A0AAD4NUV9_9PLEO|nr:hypothetical protein G6011_04355 [Alternaria panax]
MYPRLQRAAGDVCLRCQWRALIQRGNLRPTPNLRRLSTVKVPQTQRRALHAAATTRSQQPSLATTSTPTPDPSLLARPQGIPVREHLERWQHQFGGPTEEVLAAFENHPGRNDTYNGLSNLSSAFQADQDVRESEWDAAQEDGGDQAITTGLFLKPGDVVELSQPGREPVLAVFVQQLNNESQFFSVNGRWTHSLIGRVSFAIQGCIDPALLDPLVPFLPTNPGLANPKGEIHVPRELSAPVVATLEHMTAEAERIYRTNAPVLDGAYDVLADSTRTRMMTLSQIAKILLGKKDPTWVSSPAALLAVRKALNHNEFRFNSDARSHRLTNVFAIRPKADVELMETVHEWIREYREYRALSVSSFADAQDARRSRTKGTSNVTDFLVKARRLIANSRKFREPTYGGVGPSKSSSPPGESSNLRITWGEPFTSTDKQIINFLQAWVLTDQFKGMAGLQSACTSLVSASGFYGSDIFADTKTKDDSLSNIRQATGLLFLQEIGVISPHDNPAIYDEQLMLPTVRLSRNLELLNNKAELTRRNPDFRDIMAHLRRDWGSTTVYCIDDVGAHEIDDGISIERVKDASSEFWIHVHVANPTAFFDKTHTLSGLAAHMTESVYTPERFFPMLPSWVTQEYFSLDKNRPVITFSSRIDSTGCILETKIQHGIIQNIVSITPSEVAILLGDHNTTKTRRLVVGGEVPRGKERPPPSIDPSQLEELRDLYTAAQALWERRRIAGGVRFATGNISARVFESANQGGLSWNAPSLDRARFIQGDPIIELTNSIPDSFMQLTIGPRNITEEMMLLAGQTAAAWCTERNIPVMYRGTIEPPNGDLKPKELQQLVQAHYEEHGKVRLDLAARWTRSLGMAVAHSSPLPHKIVGVPGYIKVTSPLRRFTDMIAHWQIEAAVRWEAQTGQKFKLVPDSKSILPFSQRQMQESILTLSPRERIISMAKRNSTQFWVMQAIFRAFKHKQGELPDTFRFWTRGMQLKRGLVYGDIPEYGLRAFMNTYDCEEGDEWEVALERVDLFSRLIYVKPIRLLNRTHKAT